MCLLGSRLQRRNCRLNGAPWRHSIHILVGLGRGVAIHHLGGVLCQLEFGKVLLAELASSCW